MNDNLKQIEISKIFNEDTYIIPIYQRNYAWEEKEIYQLLDDIISAEESYYLGTLIVNKKDDNTYEVIDGQQRLTTLYLLAIYLNKQNDDNRTLNISENSLKFEAREKYQKTLSRLIRNYPKTNSNDFYADELYSGLKLIDRYFNEKKTDKNNFINNFINKLDTTYLIRINVPEKIDLNHYFEIMNTRGEQLELHELAKSKFLNVFKDDTESQNAVSLIWDCCCDMNSYVQMNFLPKIRNQLFTDDWSKLIENINFEKIKEIINNTEFQNKSEYSQDPKEKQTLSEILKGNNKIQNEDKKNDEDNERFESVLSFPNFLLQVNAVNSEEEDEKSLDDKKFLKNLEDNWKDKETAKEFIIKMLKCRVLYDKYIIKREYTSKYKNGRWALQELYKYDNKPQYRASLKEAEGREEQINNQLKTLEACLRITYTSPKTMHWINEVLKALLNNENADIIKILENYCAKKVQEPDFKKESGFGIERIVFSYLDYLLYRDGYNDIIQPLDNSWEVQYRNSIEHFEPQHSLTDNKWSENDLNMFGNLALLSVSGNSILSNMPPAGKIKIPNIVEQSLKLKIMKSIIEKEGHWLPENAKQHQEDMFGILDNNIN